ncbi:hypothetical protein [Halogranum rubrum]|uniref:hypothetical protein n=1 Tax=Halogranum rubrum TaxID=553466 RepID=UPI001160D1BC|nr:hypothetical protein [Halogranum rubrum]
MSWNRSYRRLLPVDSNPENCLTGAFRHHTQEMDAPQRRGDDHPESGIVAADSSSNGEYSQPRSVVGF